MFSPFSILFSQSLAIASPTTPASSTPAARFTSTKNSGRVSVPAVLPAGYKTTTAPVAPTGNGRASAPAVPAAAASSTAASATEPTATSAPRRPDSDDRTSRRCSKGKAVENGNQDARESRKRSTNMTPSRPSRPSSEPADSDQPCKFCMNMLSNFHTYVSSWDLRLETNFY